MALKKKMLISSCQTARSEPELFTVLVTTSTRGGDGTQNRKWKSKKHVQFLKLLVCECLLPLLVS